MLAKAWRGELGAMGEGQRMLEDERYQFPSDWLWWANLDGEFSAFAQLLARKGKAMARAIGFIPLCTLSTRGDIMKCPTAACHTHTAAAARLAA